MSFLSTVRQRLRRALLRESDLEYAARFAGDDAYWEEALAAQLRCSQPEFAPVLPPTRPKDGSQKAAGSTS